MKYASISRKSDILNSLDAGHTGNDPLDLSNALDEAVPSSATKSKENRGEQRYRVKWHASATIDGLGTHQGFIKDISTKGTAIFLGLNLQGVRLATLRIQMPPLEPRGDTHVIEVQGKVIYCNHDSEELFFRSGILFTQFKEASDLAFLSARLKNCHVKILD